MPPDVIHAHWAYEFSLATLATKIPHVVTCHDSPFQIARMASRSKPTISLYRWLRVAMARKVLRDAQCVTAVSPYMRDEVQPITTAKIAVVPNPVDDRALTLARARHAPAMPRLAMVCNGWGAWKNPQPALLAFAEFRKSRAPGRTASLWQRFRPRPGSGVVVRAKWHCRGHGFSRQCCSSIAFAGTGGM